MKKVIKTTWLLVAFLALTFNMKVALAQDPDDTINNGTDNNINNNTTDDNGTINNGTDNNTNNKGVNDNTDNNGNDNGYIDDNDDDVAEENNDTVADNNNDLVENVTYGLGGAILGGLVTYFAARDRRTVAV